MLNYRVRSVLYIKAVQTDWTLRINDEGEEKCMKAKFKNECLASL